jgi:hypothetical protein
MGRAENRPIRLHSMKGLSTAISIDRCAVFRSPYKTSFSFTRGLTIKSGKATCWPLIGTLLLATSTMGCGNKALVAPGKTTANTGSVNHMNEERIPGNAPRYHNYTLATRGEWGKESWTEGRLLEPDENLSLTVRITSQSDVTELSGTLTVQLVSVKTGEVARSRTIAGAFQRQARQDGRLYVVGQNGRSSSILLRSGNGWEMNNSDVFESRRFREGSIPLPLGEFALHVKVELESGVTLMSDTSRLEIKYIAK